MDTLLTEIIDQAKAIRAQSMKTQKNLKINSNDLISVLDTLKQMNPELQN